MNLFNRQAYYLTMCVEPHIVPYEEFGIQSDVQLLLM
jgi:hypothetical protein